jgi:hypothetical protein
VAASRGRIASASNFSAVDVEARAWIPPGDECYGQGGGGDDHRDIVTASPARSAIRLNSGGSPGSRWILTHLDIPRSSSARREDVHPRRGFSLIVASPGPPSSWRHGAFTGDILYFSRGAASDERSSSGTPGGARSVARAMDGKPSADFRDEVPLRHTVVGAVLAGSSRMSFKRFRHSRFPRVSWGRGRRAPGRRGRDKRSGCRGPSLATRSSSLWSSYCRDPTPSREVGRARLEGRRRTSPRSAVICGEPPGAPEAVSS